MEMGGEKESIATIIVYHPAHRQHPVCLAHIYDILLALLSSLRIFHELLALSPYFQGFVADMCPLWALSAAPCSVSIVKLAGY